MSSLDVRSQSGRRLFERTTELSAAQRAIDDARAGRGSLVQIEGPAGIGKSRLLESCSTLAAEAAMPVLRARCSRLELDHGLGVAHQLLADRVLAGGEVADEAMFAGAAGLALPLFDDTAGRLDRRAGDAAFSLFHGLFWLIANLAERSPLVALVDDVHWSDPSSLAFLNFLAQRVEELPVAVAIARRVGEPAESEDLLSELRASAHLTLEPSPLGAEASAQFVRETLPGADEEFCARCWQMTRGNPLYLRELVVAVENEGLEPVADRTDALNALGPESISRSVLARLDRLPPTARRFAEAVAVADASLTLDRAAGLAGLETDEAIAAADMLVAAQMLAPGEPLSFVHPIVGGAVYGAIGPGRASHIHLEAARSLANDGAAPEFVAAHVIRAHRSGEEWVWPVLRRAAQRARSRGAQQAAIRYLRRALEEQPPDEVRGELLALQGLTESEAGDTRGARTLGEAVEVISDPETRARALFHLGMVLSHAGSYARATEVAQRGLDELNGDGPRLAGKLRALRDMSATWVDLTDADATRAHLESAVAEPGLERTPEGRAVIANSAVGLAFADSDAATIGSLAERAFAVPEPRDDAFDRVAFPLIGLAFVYAGDIDAAERAASAAVEAATAHGSVLDRGAAAQVRAIARHEAGKVAEAFADAEIAVDAGRWGWGATLPMAHAHAILAALERGDLESAERAIGLPGGDERWFANVAFGTYMLARAELWRARGEKDEALAELRRVGALTEAAHAITPVVCPWRPPAAAILVERGESDEAAELAGEGLEIARRFGAPRPVGVALRALGLATGGSRGLELLEESVDVLREPEPRLQLAHSLVAFGAALRREGKRSKARSVLRDGLDRAYRCGARPLADRAAEELRVAGGRPRRRALTGVEALTPSELRTARLAADGLANREIAERLFVTRRTVEMHLSAAYTKLAIPSRDELPAALDGGGALSPPATG